MKKKATKPKFKALTPAQKRVAIAKDVLAQIKLGKFLIKTGNFCALNAAGGIEMEMAIGKNQLLNSKLVKNCTVCAIGSAIVSGIRLFNKLEINGGAISPYESWQMITKFFSPEQAVLIENAFECGWGNYTADNWDEDDGGMLDVIEGTTKLDTAIVFGEKFEDVTERAVAIFANIVKNKGVFKP